MGRETMTKSEKINLYNVLIKNSICEAEEFLKDIDTDDNGARKIQYISGYLKGIDRYTDDIKKLHDTY